MDPDTSRIGQLLDEAIERGRPEMRVEAASAPVLVRNNGSRSVRIEPPLSCPSGLDGLNGRCSIRDQSIDHPRRRTSRRGAEVGGQSDTGVIYSCRPALGTPPLCHLDDRRRVLDLLSGSLHNEIELVGRHAQGAPRITGEISALPSLLSGLEPEGVIDPECAYARQVRTAILIDRRQPARVPIRSPSTGAWVTPSVSRSAMLFQSRSGRA